MTALRMSRESGGELVRCSTCRLHTLVRGRAAPEEERFSQGGIFNFMALKSI